VPRGQIRRRHGAAATVDALLDTTAGAADEALEAIGRDIEVDVGLEDRGDQVDQRRAGELALAQVVERLAVRVLGLGERVDRDRAAEEAVGTPRDRTARAPR
jgi:hypothetical protein